MSLESWKVLFEVGAVVAGLFAGGFAAGALWVGREITIQNDATSRLKDERALIDSRNKDVQIAELNKATSDAVIEQGKQQERAAKAEKALVEVSNAAGAANENAGKANERAAKLELDAATQRERAANAERKLLELQEQVKWRSISQNDAATLIANLQRSDIKGPIELSSILGDSEGKAFGRQIEGVLKAAGWPILGVGGTVATYVTNPIGLQFEVRSPSNPPPHLFVLIRLLEPIGMSNRVGSDATVPDGAVRIVVGTKP